MIRLQQLKFDLNHKKEDIKSKILKTLRIEANQLIAYTIIKKINRCAEEKRYKDRIYS